MCARADDDFVRARGCRETKNGNQATVRRKHTLPLNRWSWDIGSQEEKNNKERERETKKPRRQSCHFVMGFNEFVTKNQGLFTFEYLHAFLVLHPHPRAKPGFRFIFGAIPCRHITSQYCADHKLPTYLLFSNSFMDVRFAIEAYGGNVKIVLALISVDVVLLPDDGGLEGQKDSSF